MTQLANHSVRSSQRPLLGQSMVHRAQAHCIGLLRLWRVWRRRARELRYARQFTDRDLWDVGLTRGDLYREFSRPLRPADGRRRRL